MRRVSYRSLVFALIVFTAFGISANESPPEKAAPVKVVDEDAGIPILDYRRNSSDVSLPEILWNKFESFAEDNKDQEKNVDSHSSGKQAAPGEHEKPSTNDKEKNHSASNDLQSHSKKSPNSEEKSLQSEMFFPRVIVTRSGERDEKEKIKVRFAEGGGSIDLKKIAPRLKGKINLLIEFPLALKELKHKVFFLSNYKREIKNGKTLGSGCSTALDVTSFFDEKMAHDGFELTLDHHEYLPIYGGSYYLVAKGPNRMYLARVTLTDSRFNDLSCDPK